MLNDDSRDESEAMPRVPVRPRRPDPCREGHWADRITDAIRRINDGDLSGVDYLLRAFGGMGSLNDLLIHEANGHSIAAVDVGPVNDRLDELRTRVYSAASRIRRSSDRPG